MGKIFSYYLKAFKNSFDFKTTAERSELNWFVAFMFVFLFVASVVIMGICLISVILSPDSASMQVFDIFMILGFSYMLIHFFPLLSLIKRRFNKLFPNKTALLFSIFSIIWGFQILSALVMYFMIKFITVENLNILYLLPLGLLNNLCGITLFLGLIFLMVKK